MKFLAENRAVFENLVDDGCSPEHSIVCRYRNVMQFHDDTEQDLTLKRHLLETTVREGARIVKLVDYKGVEVHLLDETSWMATGSLKAIDGCLTTALCLLEGAGRMVFESGGNTGSALTLYGQHAGLETFFFCPVENLDLLDSRLFLHEKSHLAGVTDRTRLKEFTRLFAQRSGMRHLPEKNWRYAASMIRGLFILEQMVAFRTFDWISQTISAAFGPIGIYRTLDTFRAELPRMPKFLGIQQEVNCPMYRAWRQEQPEPPANAEQQDRLLTRVMYDQSPQTYNTYSDLHSLLQLTGGEMLTVNEAEFDASLDSSAGPILPLLASQGVPVTMRGGEIVEKTGMVALAGTFKAIDAGTIPAGSSVLCCMTGGMTDADGNAQPETLIRSREDVLDYLERFAGER